MITNQITGLDLDLFLCTFMAIDFNQLIKLLNQLLKITGILKNLTVVLTNRPKNIKCVPLDDRLGLVDLSQQRAKPIKNTLFNPMIIRTNNKSLKNDQTGHSVLQPLNNNILIYKIEHQ